MTRHRVREHLFKILFGTEFHSVQEIDEQYDMYWSTEDDEPTDKEHEEIKAKIKAIIDNKAELDDYIERFAKGWKLNRIGNADLNILRIAIYEIKYDDNVPVKVAINEAVEFAKEYGTDNSSAFVNGILAGIVDEIGGDC